MTSSNQQIRPTARRAEPGIPAWLYAALAALFVTIAFNRALLANLSDQVSWQNGSDLWAAIAVLYLVTAVSFLLLLPLGPRRLQKLLTAAYIVAAAIIAFFVDRYGVIFNESMIRNVMDTVSERNVSEAAELVSVPLLLYLGVFGMAPALAAWLIPIKKRKPGKEIRSRFVAGILAVVLGGLFVVPGSQSVIAFAAKHRDLRHFITPLYAIASIEKYYRHKQTRDGIPFRQLGLDVHRGADHTRRTIGVLIVGETQRADHFSLNGYPRPTNPLLEQDDVISFANAYSCGTATALSLPCMFSMRGRSTFDVDSIRHESNVLDLLGRAGVGVLWLEGNSGCKLVCARVAYENLTKRPNISSDARIQYYDEQLVGALSNHLGESGGDLLIILHMLGSHGPAYGQRVPPAFHVFEPSCSGNSPITCERDQLVNAYDNTILYADFVVDQVISKLRSLSSQADTFMVFVSDHGESLGENGIYLHGLPYAMAPDAQKHIPMIFWTSEEFAERHLPPRPVLVEAAQQPVSHDNIAHLLLGLYEVRTSLYNRALDPFAKRPPRRSR